MLLLAQGTILVMAAAALVVAYMKTSFAAIKRMFEKNHNGVFGASMLLLSAWAYRLLVTGWVTAPTQLTGS